MALLSACAQWWQVRPWPDFVAAEIRPGDVLRVTTRDGYHGEMTVVSLQADRITGKERTVLLADIVMLEKKSGTSPANPCSPQVPLGCSVPQWATYLHDSQAEYQAFFYPSCEQHDYCYRHGAATYGKTRAACDYEFLLDMQEQCNPDSFVETLLIGGDYVECSAVAMEFYTAVQKYGAARYTATGGARCEYDGPP